MRLGSVPYLNARPLTEWFTETDEGRATGAELLFEVPSQLAPRLAPGELHAGLVSSVAWIRRPQLVYAPGIAVASVGEVRSVRLFSTVPVEQIRRVALDTSSLTSVTLTRLLLGERYGLSPTYMPLPPDLTTMLAENDAALLIGDTGYQQYDSRLTVLDLGTEWQEWTDLPFVFALWIGRDDLLTPELMATLHTAKEWGKAHRAEIAERRAAEHRTTPERALSYMNEAIHYDLTPEAEAGLRLFAEKVRAHGLV